MIAKTSQLRVLYDFSKELWLNCNVERMSKQSVYAEAYVGPRLKRSVPVNEVALNAHRLGVQIHTFKLKFKLKGCQFLNDVA